MSHDVIIGALFERDRPRPLKSRSLAGLVLNKEVNAT